MLLRRLLAGGRGRVEDCFQGPEVAMAHVAFEPLLGAQEGRSHPAQHHLAVLPMRDAARPANVRLGGCDSLRQIPGN